MADTLWGLPVIDVEELSDVQIVVGWPRLRQEFALERIEGDDAGPVVFRMVPKGEPYVVGQD